MYYIYFEQKNLHLTKGECLKKKLHYNKNKDKEGGVSEKNIN